MSNDDRSEQAARYAALEAEAPTIPASELAKRSRRSFLTGAVAVAAGYGGWRWLQGRPDADRIPDVLRAGHEFNEDLWRRLYREGQEAPTFDPSEASILRVNGRHGIREEIDLDQWHLEVQGPDGTVLGTHLMADITALPKTEMTVEHKCVEGWAHIVTWGGTRFSELIHLYRDDLGELTDFVALETPDGDYYVGIDMDSALHSQTMLTYELGGEPLDQDHGAPLRLTTPLKYGIKQIKRIGVIRFTNEAPDDYWAERGYDYYAHL